MNKFTRSWSLMKASWNVLRQDREMLLFPLLSSVACVLLLASFILPVVLTSDWSGKEFHTDISDPVAFAMAFGFYFGNYFIVTFFNTALVACAVKRLRGGDPTFSEGLAEARDRLGLIVKWALLQATVGMILRAIEERVGFIGRIVASLLGVLWSVATFFVVPVLVVERKGPFDALKESAALFKKSWGERAVAAVSFSLVGMVLAIPGFFLGFLAVWAFATLGFGWVAVNLLAATVLYFVLLSLTISVLQAIFQTALYLYARDGYVAPGFDETALSTAMKPKT
jgi:hypothetical protein